VTTRDFALDEGQLTLGVTVRGFLEACSDEAAVRRQMMSVAGYQPDTWKQLAMQLGLTGLALPGSVGGAGKTSVELSVVFSELGRSLACLPFLSTVGMAASLLARVPADSQTSQYLAGIIDGSVLATVALADAEGTWDDRRPSVHAVADGDGWLLTGEKHYVLDAHLANLILVGAATNDGFAVFAVENDPNCGSARLEVTPLEVLDRTRRQSTIRLNGVPGRLVGEPGSGRLLLDGVRDLAAVYLAAEQAGGAERLLELVVEHAKARIQFGRPIGSFQAVKHKCAEMLLLVESAKSAAYYSSAAAAEGSEEFPALASLAKAYCSDAYLSVATTAIQLFGGIGFTWEHPAHLYFRRANGSSQLFGDPYYHREMLARRLGV
jgi:alkylation response protein AidB-like acyl-CoA dehydrogenase